MDDFSEASLALGGAGAGHLRQQASELVASSGSLAAALLASAITNTNINLTNTASTMATTTVTSNNDLTNTISEEDELKLLNFPSKREDLTTAIPLTVIFALLLVTGCIGNLCTAIVIARPKNKYMHTATNYYLFSLAMSDFLFLILGLPQEMYQLWQRYPYAFGEAFCIIRGYLSEASTYASILTISAFTVERYVAICHPLWAHTMSQLPRAITSIVIIWILAAICAIPPAAELGIVTQNGPLTNRTLEQSAQCAMKRSIYENMFIVSAIVFFIVPMIIVTVLYILIAIELRRSSKMNSAISKQQIASKQQQLSNWSNNNNKQNELLTSPQFALANGHCRLHCCSSSLLFKNHHRQPRHKHLSFSTRACSHQHLIGLTNNNSNHNAQIDRNYSFCPSSSLVLANPTEYGIGTSTAISNNNNNDATRISEAPPNNERNNENSLMANLMSQRPSSALGTTFGLQKRQQFSIWPNVIPTWKSSARCICERCHQNQLANSSKCRPPSLSCNLKASSLVKESESNGDLENCQSSPLSHHESLIQRQAKHHRPHQHNDINSSNSSSASNDNNSFNQHQQQQQQQQQQRQQQQQQHQYQHQPSSPSPANQTITIASNKQVNKLKQADQRHFIAAHQASLTCNSISPRPSQIVSSSLALNQLNQTQQNLPIGLQSRRSRSSASSKKSVIRMLVAVVVSFFICWVPFHAQRLLASYLVKDENQNQLLLDIYRKLTYISGVMYYLSSTINPLLYQLMSAKFRLAFKETFKCSLFKCARLGRSNNQQSLHHHHHHHHHHQQKHRHHRHHHHHNNHYHTNQHSQQEEYHHSPISSIKEAHLADGRSGAHQHLARWDSTKATNSELCSGTNAISLYLDCGCLAELAELDSLEQDSEIHSNGRLARLGWRLSSSLASLFGRFGINGSQQIQRQEQERLHCQCCLNQPSQIENSIDRQQNHHHQQQHHIGSNNNETRWRQSSGEDGVSTPLLADTEVSSSPAQSTSLQSVPFSANGNQLRQSFATNSMLKFIRTNRDVGEPQNLDTKLAHLSEIDSADCGRDETDELASVESNKLTYLSSKEGNSKSIQPTATSNVVLTSGKMEALIKPTQLATSDTENEPSELESASLAEMNASIKQENDVQYQEKLKQPEKKLQARYCIRQLSSESSGNSTGSSPDQRPLAPAASGSEQAEASVRVSRCRSLQLSSSQSRKSISLSISNVNSKADGSLDQINVQPAAVLLPPPVDANATDLVGGQRHHRRKSSSSPSPALSHRQLSQSSQSSCSERQLDKKFSLSTTTSALEDYESITTTNSQLTACNGGGGTGSRRQSTNSDLIEEDPSTVINAIQAHELALELELNTESLIVSETKFPSLLNGTNRKNMCETNQLGPL